MRKIKAAVVGLGFIGMAHVEALRRLNGIEVTSIVGTNNEKTKEKAVLLDVPNYYSRFEDMLAEPSIDSVHICTPNNLHYELCKLAMLAGKHVICEKPLTVTVAEAQELSELAAKSNLVDAICFNIRYYPLIQQVKRMIRDGEIGEIHAVNGSYLQDWLLYDNDYNWRVDTELSGKSRAIADIGSHWLDLIEFITGEHITEVLADFTTVHKFRKKPLQALETYVGKMEQSDPLKYCEVPIQTEDYANVLMGFSNGARGTLTVSQVHAGRKNRVYFEIAGSKRTVSWDSENPNYLWIGCRDGNNEVVMKDPSLVHVDSRRYMDYPGGHNEGFPDTFKQLFKDVYEAIRSKEKRSMHSFPRFVDGLREQLLCEKIYESHHSRKWITI